MTGGGVNGRPGHREPDGSTVTTAIVLAGGLGTRLRSVVADVPKPMAPVNGRPFLEHLLEYWIDRGIVRFILSVGYLHDVIKSHFGTAWRGADIGYSVEREPLGTGGGLLQAVAGQGVGDDVLLLNGDTYFEVDLDALARFHFRNGSDWTFSLFRSEARERYMGIALDRNGRVTGLGEVRDTGPLLVNGGVYLVNTRILGTCDGGAGRPASLERDMLPRLLAGGAGLYGMEFPGRFLDIGIPADYARADGLLGGISRNR